MRRTVTYVQDYDFYTLGRWDGTSVNRTRAEIMDAPMSDDTAQTMRELLDRAKTNPGQAIEYPEG